MLKLGPTVMVTLKAVLVTPEVKVSTETLDFGPVPTGKTKVRSAAGTLAEACCHSLLVGSLVSTPLPRCCPCSGFLTGTVPAAGHAGHAAKPAGGSSRLAGEGPAGSRRCQGLGLLQGTARAGGAAAWAEGPAQGDTVKRWATRLASLLPASLCCWRRPGQMWHTGLTDSALLVAALHLTRAAEVTCIFPVGSDCSAAHCVSLALL